MFGLPYILRDNGKEFVNNLIVETMRHGLENVNWSMEKQEAPECKDVLKKETARFK